MSSRELFETEILPCMDRVYGRALSLVKNSAAAEDLLQETFLKAWRSLESYQAGTHPSAWLNRILYGLFVDQYRRKQTCGDERSLQTLPDVWEADSIGDGVPLTEKALESWGGDEVVEALQTLSEDSRVIVIMIDVDAFTYDDVASLLEIPVGTVKSRLYRARQMLYEKLYQYARKNGFISETTEVGS